MKIDQHALWRTTLVASAALSLHAVSCSSDRFSGCESTRTCAAHTGGSGGEGGQVPDEKETGAATPTSGGATSSGGDSGGASSAGGASSTGGGSSAGGSLPGAAGDPNLPPCAPGFERDAQEECADIAECEVDNGGCDPDAECHESEVPADPPTCSCPEGFVGDGFECELEVIDFSVGDEQACAVRSDHSLVCWGLNSFGELGADSVGGALLWPAPIGEGIEWDSVSVGLTHICGLSHGAAYCWGRNAYGALGQGEPGEGSDLTEPARVGDDDDWQQIVAGRFFTCGIRADERLYCWGLHPAAASSDEFTSLPVEVGLEPGWSEVALAHLHACGIRNGQVYCFGDNRYDTVGVDVETPERFVEPVLVDADNDWTALSAYSLYTCGIKGNGTLHCWGGTWGPVSNEYIPTQVGSWTDWQAISVGELEGCGIRAGELMCWGGSARGLRGEGEPDEIQITATQFGADWEKASVGSQYACALKSGRLYCWGHNANGKLGVGDDFPASAATPQRVGDSNQWTTVSAGGAVSCGLHEGGAFCWGAQQGQDLKYGPFPQQIGAENDWTSISAGFYTIAGIRAHQLFWWRYPASEGANGTRVTPEPVQDGLGRSWQSVHAGCSYSAPICAIGNPGDSLYCYGPMNTYGELGLGDRSTPNEPRQVGTSSTWAVVAPSSTHGCGIDAGRLFCWGRNTNGQLGIGDDVLDEDQLSPVQVGSNDDWSDVATSDSSVSCGIRQGALYCWGLNTYARPSLGVSENVATPTRVGELTNWKQVAVSRYHGCGILESGELYCWGVDTAGQLGLNLDSLAAPISEPTRVGSGSNWVLVSLGEEHTCGLRGDGSVWCWGDNTSGQIGIGPSWSTTPVPVSMD